MAETEGVIKYRLEFRQAPAPAAGLIGEINGWRDVLHRLGLLGQEPGRYAGLGFGNVSLRLADGSGFVISGTQTGHLGRLGAQHYCLVTRCEPEHNRIIAQGPVRPSSEALTHGALYAADPQIRCVLHAHSPDIWTLRDRLGLAATGAEVPYGTPAMAIQVQELLRGPAARQGIFAMAGHEDGVVAFGPDPEAAGGVLVSYLARALAGH